MGEHEPARLVNMHYLPRSRGILTSRCILRREPSAVGTLGTDIVFTCLEGK